MAINETPTEKGFSEGTTKILSCSCKHEAQDRIYGSGLRLHNRTMQTKARESRKWRCTVCKGER